MKYILAPKYWARHNVSDGYWASEQNIYEGWHYQDRHGKVFSAGECKEELEQYKQTSPLYATLNVRPEGSKLKAQERKSRIRYAKHRALRLARGAKRKLKLLVKKV